MIVYEKKTKTNTKIAPIISFFVKEILRILELRNWKKGDGLATISISTREHEYCYDAIRMVEKTFRRMKCECKMTYYYRTESSKTFAYVWEIKEMK